jgi:DNA-binding transcriptional LysR family regulator
MNVTTRQLEAFLAVARLGSITRASEELFLTQAGLSLMLKSLEDQVGARLFDRTTRTVRITPAGESLLPSVRTMLGEWERATSEVGRLAASAEQQLTLAATPLIASSVLPRWLSSFLRAQPGMRVMVRDVDREGILRGIEAAEIDIGLGAFFKPVSGIERKALASFPMMRLEARAGAKASSRKRATWSSFAGERLLTLGPDNPIQKVVDTQLRNQGVAVDRADPLENLQAIIAMVEAHHGVAALPAFVAPACARYEVKLQVLVEPSVPIDFFAVSKKGRVQTMLANRLIDALSTHFRQIAKAANESSGFDPEVVAAHGG